MNKIENIQLVQLDKDNGKVRVIFIEDGQANFAPLIDTATGPIFKFSKDENSNWDFNELEIENQTPLVRVAQVERSAIKEFKLEKMDDSSFKLAIIGTSDDRDIFLKKSPSTGGEIEEGQLFSFITTETDFIFFKEQLPEPEPEPEPGPDPVSE